jgi:hypothetical protein
LYATATRLQITYVELRLVYILEEDGYRVLPGFAVVDVTRAMRGQIGLSMLVLRYLELPAQDSLARANVQRTRCLPLIEPYSILDEQQSLLRQERRAQCGGEIELVQEHSGHLRVVCTIARCFAQTT